MRFLGESPSDWQDEVFEYELRFEAVPNDEAVEALANAWNAHCKKGVTGRAGWRFSREFAYLNCVAGRGGAQKLFPDVAKFIRAAHKIAPLREVVHITAAEDFPGLEPGPAFRGSQRPIDASYPEPSGHPVFDRVFAAIFEAERNARFQIAVAPPKPKCVGLAFCDPASPLEQSAYPEYLHALYPANDGMSFDGSPTHPRRAGRYLQFYKSLKVRIGGAERQIDLPETTSTTRVSAPHPSGDCISFHLSTQAREETVVLLDPASGALREVWRAAPEDKKIQRLNWLTHHCLAIETETRLVVIDTEDAAPSVLDARRACDSRCSLMGGRLLWCYPMQLFAWNGKKLRPAGNIKFQKLFFVRELEGRVIFRHGDAQQVRDSDQYFELVNTHEALGSQEPKASTKPKPTKPKPAQPKPSAGAKKKPAWVPAEGITPPPPVSEADATQARGGWTHPGNVIDALMRWGDENNPSAVRATEADAIATMNAEGFTLAHGGEVLRFENHAAKRVAISPLGTRGFGVQGDHMLHTFGPESPTSTLIHSGHMGEKLGEVHDFAAIGEDEVVVLTKKTMLFLARVEDGTWKETARHSALKKGISVVVLGDVVAAISPGAAPLQVLRRDGDKVRKLLSDKDGATKLFVSDGAIHSVRSSGAVVRLAI